MKTFRELNEIVISAKNKKYSVLRARAKKELADLDAKAGDSLRIPGTRRHNLHKQIQNHERKLKELNR